MAVFDRYSFEAAKVPVRNLSVRLKDPAIYHTRYA